MQNFTLPRFPAPDGGAFHNNPALKAQALASLTAVPAHLMVTHCFFRETLRSTLAFKLIQHGWGGIGLQGCMLMQLAVGQGFTQRRQVVADFLNRHVEDPYRLIVFRAIQTEYNFPRHFQEVLMDAYDRADTTICLKSLALSLLTAIAPGTDLALVATAFEKQRTKTAFSRQYNVLIQCLNDYAPAQPVPRTYGVLALA